MKTSTLFLVDVTSTMGAERTMTFLSHRVVIFFSSHIIHEILDSLCEGALPVTRVHARLHRHYRGDETRGELRDEKDLVKGICTESVIKFKSYHCYYERANKTHTNT